MRNDPVSPRSISALSDNSQAPPSDSQLPAIPSQSQLFYDVTGDVSVDSVEDDEDFDEFLPDPDAPSPADIFLDRFRDLSRNFSLANWNDFESLVDEFISFAQKHNGIKSNDSIPFKSKPNNSTNPSFIQRLYRRNRWRAVRLIREDTKPQCDVSVDALKKKYFSSSTPDTDLTVYNNVVPASDMPSEKPFSVNEVCLKLQKSENTAPGPDRLTYFHFQKVDLEG